MYITKYQDIRQICNVFDNWYECQELLGNFTYNIYIV